MEDQKFRIHKSRFLLTEGTAYIITAGGFYNRNIYGEGHLLILSPYREPLVFHMDPSHFPKDVGFELDAVLSAQFATARDHLERWLSEQIGHKARGELNRMSWEPIETAAAMAMLLRRDDRMMEMFDEVVANSNCGELAAFISKSRRLDISDPAIRWA